MNEILTQIVPAVIAAVLAITLHEAAHGYAALALGDDTARLAGRVSLNEGYVRVDGERNALFLIGVNIGEYAPAGPQQHAAVRARKAKLKK